ncbi:hypothetical protein GCM10010124_06350 [Pilimelia terevasa]|uniref:HTH cro/C1-type domain-containing protein n=1 Tax=Pilimelia terevasa TaxID=53372 RepID=A0A8J3FEE5_9ACTN|nr:helix-turn-helix domain-containing protein [Pilimelia terevasa]GGK16482.1 hypothetical protein GCM10010124_06350 [Pilimelia terevasa]
MPTDALATMLTDLKRRSGLSYDVIGRRTHISKSTIHRYCRGESVPPDFATVERIAALCGATSAERGRLYASWSSAATGAAAEPAGAGEAGSAAEAGALAGSGSGVRSASVARSGSVARSAGGIGSASVARSGAGAESGGAAGAGSVAGSGGVGEAGGVAFTASVSGVAGLGSRRVPPGRWRLRRRAALAAVAVLALAVAGFWWPHDSPRAQTRAPLLNGECTAPVALGQTNGCVSVLQGLLARAGAEIVVDGSFGPITQGKLTAFQFLADLPVTGVADVATRKALHAGVAPLRSWPRDQVEARIRAVFVEAPDEAVRVAECRSHLDAMSVTPGGDGTRNWGVFQLSDRLLAEIGGTPRQALDPEWNIQAAHRRYRTHGDFGDRSCDPVNGTVVRAAPAAAGRAAPTGPGRPS